MEILKYNIKILSKEECILFSKDIINEKHIIISINDSNCDTEIFSNANIIKVYRAWFDDITKPIDGCRLMSIADALDIKNFVDLYKDKITNIVVHCTAGISRSGAVGCFLARYLNGDDSYLLSTGEYIPNKHVYKAMCEVFNLNYSERLFKEKLKIRNKGNVNNLKGYGDYGIKLNDMFCDIIKK